LTGGTGNSARYQISVVSLRPRATNCTHLVYQSCPTLDAGLERHGSLRERRQKGVGLPAGINGSGLMIGRSGAYLRSASI
jgi:hypothetical protein